MSNKEAKRAAGKKAAEWIKPGMICWARDRNNGCLLH